MPLTLVEKIATRYADGLAVGAAALQGQIIRIRPKHVMTHDNTGAVIPKFESIFAGTGKVPRIADAAVPVVAIDHDIQNHTPQNLAKYAKIGKFARDHGIDFYPAGTGISHQVMIEQGYVVPGSMVVGSDSHSNMYGAMSALGTPVVRTDAACLWATGSTWWTVPRVARCRLVGQLMPGVVGKDVIIALCGMVNNDEVLNCAVEFVGPGIAALSMDHRLSIANMTTEWGALAGVFPFDEVLKAFLHDRADEFKAGRRPGERGEHSLGSYSHEDIENWWADRLVADDDALYAVELELDLSTVIPHVSGPNEVKTMTSLPAMEKRRVAIHKAYLVSCVNARFEDLAEAAAIVAGKQIAPGVGFYVAAASAAIQARAEEAGHWQRLMSAGATMLPPGCGPCIGLGTGLVEDGEVAISATNRNFKGRMGSRDAEVYLGSPAVVAASALAGYICSPVSYEEVEPRVSVRVIEGDRSSSVAGAADIIEGFPKRISGRTLLLDHDNLNTDGIFAGKWTYRDDLTHDQMAAVVFENYDPNFDGVYEPGDIIVSGRNFGTGSSREQAATALKYRGVPCVIASSFSETYRRNAFNNGFLCLECPALVEHLRQSHAGNGSATVVCEPIEVDFERSEITLASERFPFPTLSTVAQELVVAGGAEAIARASLAH